MGRGSTTPRGHPRGNATLALIVLKVIASRDLCPTVRLLFTRRQLVVWTPTVGFRMDFPEINMEVFLDFSHVSGCLDHFSGKPEKCGSCFFWATPLRHHSWSSLMCDA